MNLLMKIFETCWQLLQYSGFRTNFLLKLILLSFSLVLNCKNKILLLWIAFQYKYLQININSPPLTNF